MPVLDRGVVGDDEEFQLLARAVVGDLMCLERRMDEGVAGGDGERFVVHAHAGGATPDVEKFPLGGVKMKRAAAFIGGETRVFEIERVAAETDGRVPLCSECDRELLAGAVKFFLGDWPQSSHGRSARLRLRSANGVSAGATGEPEA